VLAPRPDPRPARRAGAARVARRRPLDARRARRDRPGCSARRVWAGVRLAPKRRGGAASGRAVRCWSGRTDLSRRCARMRVTASATAARSTTQAEVDPQTVVICHCADCQLSPAALSRDGQAAAGHAGDDGSPTHYTRPPRAGASASRRSAAPAAPPVRLRSGEAQRALALRIGAIAERHQLAPPRRQLWCDSALAWAFDLSAVPRVDSRLRHPPPRGTRRSGEDALSRSSSLAGGVAEVDGGLFGRSRRIRNRSAAATAGSPGRRGRTPSTRAPSPRPAPRTARAGTPRPITE
jgi:hypothetical protein